MLPKHKRIAPFLRHRRLRLIAQHHPKDTVPRSPDRQHEIHPLGDAQPVQRDQEFIRGVPAETAPRLSNLL